jgi:hypothetical protein
VPLKKIQFKAGVNRENTRYTNEMGWYEAQLVRFRQGTPETIGGWQKLSDYTYQGVCRALWSWITLDGFNLVAAGTNLKYYIERGGVYYDITPLADTTTGDATFAATAGSSVLTVSDSGYTGYISGDFVTFSDAVGLGGNITAAVLNKEYEIIFADQGSGTYTIDVGVTANASDIGDGGGATVAEYQINVGPAVQIPITGWGAGQWGFGPWGIGTPSTDELRIWSQANYGEALIFGPRYGGIYYWDPTGGVSNNRAVNVADIVGASDVPVTQHYIIVSDVSRFVFAFGCNEVGSTTADPMLIRWSDQEDYLNWTPLPTNQAGEIRLSHGSEISTAIQTRQEIVVLTDMAVYSLQYVGAPIVWQVTLLADGTSSISPNGAVFASNTLYWMGNDKFYKYDGTVQTLRCDLRRHVFDNINRDQPYQIFAGGVAAFNEVWWFYCSANSTMVDSYVVYNYAEDVWYYGSLARTAWLDTDVRKYPIGATYNNNLVYHENGLNDFAGATPQPLNASISSAEWDADDGHNFSFMYRMLPDITFENSTAANPTATMSITPLKNSGSGYTNPPSVGGSNAANVNRVATVPIEQFTGQVFIRVRGRQFVFKIESNQLDTAWQLGSPRVDIRSDGRR